MKISNNIKTWLKYVFFFLLILISIITCSGVWNGIYLTKDAIDATKTVGSFYGWIAGINILISIFTGWVTCFKKY